MVLDLNPYVLQLGSFGIRWYGLLMAISILLGAVYLLREGKRRGLNEDFILNLIILAVVGGVVGARLMFVLTNFPGWFIHNPVQVLRVDQGGLAWHGALVGGFLPAWIYATRKGMLIHGLADLIVPGLSVGYMLVRLGNIFNQEVLGRETLLGFDRWPAQLIGSAIGLILLIRYFYLEKKKLPPGYQFWSFFFYHQLLRGIFEESVRENSLFWPNYLNEQAGIGLLTMTQLVTPVLLVFALVMMSWTRSRGKMFL